MPGDGRSEEPDGSGFIVPEWPAGAPIVQFDLLAAEKMWEEVLRRTPDDGLAHANLAWVLVAQGEGSRAREHLANALRLAPAEPHVHFVRSMVRLDGVRWLDFPLLGTGCTDPWVVRAAIRDVRHALGLAPEEAAYWHRLADLHRLLGRWKQVLEAVDRALQLAPDDLAATALRVQALLRLGRDVEAEAALRIALGREPESAGLHAELGWLLLGRGRDEQAARSFTESLRCDPPGERAQLGLLECGKRRFALYRWLSRIRMRLERWPLWARALSVLGSLAAAIALLGWLSEWARAWPEYRWIPMAGFGVFLGGFIFLMLADAIFGRLASRYPEGRSTRALVEGQADRLQLGVLGVAVAGAVVAIATRKLGRDIQFGVLSMAPGLYGLWVVSRIPQIGWRRFGWLYCGLLLLGAIPTALFLEAKVPRLPGWAVLACLLGPVLPLAMLEEIGRRRAVEALRRQIKNQL